jgi:hypothetical protein
VSSKNPIVRENNTIVRGVMGDVSQKNGAASASMPLQVLFKLGAVP